MQTKALARYFEILKGKKKPRFQIAKRRGLLDKKIKSAFEILKSCELCERKCYVDRTKGKKGFCKAGFDWRIFGAHPHYGEEPELTVSGTIFQAACSMRCCYCQNAPESITPELGEIWSIEKVARWIEEMKRFGCRNINWVGGSPTPWLWHILSAMKLCKADIAQVWNSNSYYSEKTSELLKDVVDIYLLDFRYFNEKCAIRLSSVPRYPQVAKRNFLAARKDSEMLIRVLVMPNHIECDAKPILKWIKDNLGAWTRVNVMEQYYPTWQANKFPEINRKLTAEEYSDVFKYAKNIGLKNLV